MLGYRAPAFSVTRDQLDGFCEICLEAGLAYDSSIFPIRGRRYGIPAMPTAPYVIHDAGGRRLVEIPLSTVEWRGRRYPVAGGGYWRILPAWAIGRIITRLNHAGCPMVTYLHPYEFDSQRLSATMAAGWSLRSLKHQLKQNLNRRSMYAKLDAILSVYRFAPAEEYLRDPGRFPPHGPGAGLL